MSYAESDDALRGELARIGKEAFRQKYGPLAHVNVPGAPFNHTKAILVELDREDEERHRRAIERAARWTAVFTAVTAVGVLISLFLH